MNFSRSEEGDGNASDKYTVDKGRHQEANEGTATVLAAYHMKLRACAYVFQSARACQTNFGLKWVAWPLESLTSVWIINSLSLSVRNFAVSGY